MNEIETVAHNLKQTDEKVEGIAEYLNQQRNEYIDKRTSSVTVKQTAKGEYYWEIKVYFDSDTPDNVVSLTKQLDEQLRTTYGGKQ